MIKLEEKERILSDQEKVRTINNDFHCIDYLREKGLLTRSLKCEHCSQYCNIFRDMSKINIEYFKCLTCKTKKSIRIISIFANFPKTPFHCYLK